MSRCFARNTRHSPRSTTRLKPRGRSKFDSAELEECEPKLTTEPCACGGCFHHRPLCCVSCGCKLVGAAKDKKHQKGCSPTLHFDRQISPNNDFTVQLRTRSGRHICCSCNTQSPTSTYITEHIQHHKMIPIIS